MKTVSYIIIFTLSALLLCAILPHPAFSRYTNISQVEAYKINNLRESEVSNNASSQTKILNLDFKHVDSLLPINSKFEIIDMQTASSFVAVRTGGKNHFDVEPADLTSAQTLRQIAAADNAAEPQIWSWTRHPVIVKLSEYAFLPASIAYYPHGYTQGSFITSGHFCLHFLGSRTDGTNMVDDAHQKCVAFAKKHAKHFLKNA